MQLDNKELLNQIEELATILKPWNEQLVVGGKLTKADFIAIIGRLHILIC